VETVETPIVGDPQTKIGPKVGQPSHQITQFHAVRREKLTRLVAENLNPDRFCEYPSARDPQVFPQRTRFGDEISGNLKTKKRPD
jgi:hypothetical protein